MAWDWENDVNFIDYVGLALLIALIVGSFYGTYRLGRWLERRALTPYIVDAIGKAYMEGRNDGEAQCADSLQKELVDAYRKSKGN